MKKTIGALLPFLVLAACSGGKKGAVTITADIKNAPAQKVILYLTDGINQAALVDSVSYNGNGPIKLKAEVEEESALQLVFEKDARMGKYLMLATDGENIKIKGDYDKIEESSIEGSPASKELMEFLNDVSDRMKEINSAVALQDSLVTIKATDSIIKSGQARIEKLMSDDVEAKRAFAKKSNHPVNAMMALKTITDIAALKSVSEDVEQVSIRFPQSTYVKNSHAAYRKYTGQPATPENGDQTSGALAKEISLPDVNGQTVTLSSMRGKYVLIDFWASWCGPCRGENPNVVAAYNKFKNKNFTILGVSLDREREAWIEAIKADKLAWTQVSDLKFWQCQAAQDYGVQGIPANFLVNPEGKIIASNLRGADLEKKLAEVLK